MKLNASQMADIYVKFFSRTEISLCKCVFQINFAEKHIGAYVVYYSISIIYCAVG